MRLGHLKQTEPKQRTKNMNTVHSDWLKKTIEDAVLNHHLQGLRDFVVTSAKQVVANNPTCEDVERLENMLSVYLENSLEDVDDSEGVWFVREYVYADPCIRG